MRRAASVSGISLNTILVLIFLILKLTGSISWSWWWVFSPWWIPVVLVAALGLLAFIAYGIYRLFYPIQKVKLKEAYPVEEIPEDLIDN